LVGKTYRKKIQKANIIEYAEHTENTQKDYNLKVKARGIVKLLKSWKQKYSKS
jgi:hypothetical protein